MQKVRHRLCFDCLNIKFQKSFHVYIILTFHLSFTLLLAIDIKLLALEIDFPRFGRRSSFYDLLCHGFCNLYVVYAAFNYPYLEN